MTRCEGHVPCHLFPALLCFRCVSCSAKFWMPRDEQWGPHQSTLLLPSGLRHWFPLLRQGSPQRDTGSRSPSGCARFLGLCHCLISSSLLFSSPLPARAQTQELLQGLSKDSWQGSQCLTLCLSEHVRTAQKRSANEKIGFWGPESN